MPPDPGQRLGPRGQADPSCVRAHLWVSGRVQGVGFRFYVQRRAGALQVAGFVRNAADGRVEVAVEGPPGAVDALVEAVRRGPVGADVREVDLAWEVPRGETAFVIRSTSRG